MNKHYHWLRRRLILALIILAIALTVIDWLQGGQVNVQLQKNGWLGIAILITEAFFVGGALLMAITAGENLLSLHPKHWVTHFSYLKREARTLAHKLIRSRLFMFGFWLNFVGAIGTSLILIIGIILFVPQAGWGVLIIVVLDLLASFGWRALAIAKRKKLIRR